MTQLIPNLYQIYKWLFVTNHNQKDHNEAHFITKVKLQRTISCIQDKCFGYLFILKFYRLIYKSCQAGPPGGRLPVLNYILLLVTDNCSMSP